MDEASGQWDEDPLASSYAEGERAALRPGADYEDLGASQPLHVLRPLPPALRASAPGSTYELQQDATIGNDDMEDALPGGLRVADHLAARDARLAVEDARLAAEDAERYAEQAIEDARLAVEHAGRDAKRVAPAVLLSEPTASPAAARLAGGSATRPQRQLTSEERQMQDLFDRGYYTGR